MDVLKPNIVRVGNMSFRDLSKTGGAVVNDGADRGPNIVQKMSQLESVNETDAEEDLRDEDIPIEELKGGKFQTSLHVPKSLRAVVIGSKGATKNRLIGNSGTHIDIPRENEDGPVKVSGFDKNAVLSVRRKILEVLNTARQRNDLTHFVSVPCNSDSVKDGFLNFKNEILKNCSESQGVCDEIFQSPGRLHLTLVPLVLLDAKERSEAEELLKRLCTEMMSHLKDNPISLQVAGLECMNDDPSEVHILYAKVHQLSGGINIQILADKLLSRFERELNYVVRARDTVKLHITLMNTAFIYRLNEYETQDVRSKRKRQPFDARDILARYSEYEFGQVTVEEIHISNRHTFDESGYYKASSKFSFVPS